MDWEGFFDFCDCWRGGEGRCGFWGLGLGVGLEDHVSFLFFSLGRKEGVVVVGLRVLEGKREGNAGEKEGGKIR